MSALCEPHVAVSVGGHGGRGMHLASQGQGECWHVLQSVLCQQRRRCSQSGLHALERSAPLAAYHSRLHNSSSRWLAGLLYPVCEGRAGPGGGGGGRV
jgi:hypothetical protein